ncbi:MAG: GNAT family N-acetyltransferase [Bacteroidota bacterium]
MTIRRATLLDARALADLSGELGYPSSEADLRARLEPLLRAEDNAVFVAIDASSRILGWIHVFVAHRVESDSFAEIGGLVVRETDRRRGIGQRLVVRAEAWAATRNVGKLRVRSRTERDGALAFYAGLGFAAAKQQAVLDKPLR